MVFDGVGNVDVEGGASIEVQSGQFALAQDPVPMDTTLHEWRQPGTNNTVRFFVGSMQDKPDLMRLCLRIDVPGALRVACTRNHRSDGRPVAADVLHDVSGSNLTHVANTDEAHPRSVLRCQGVSYASPGPGGSSYQLAQFADPVFFVNYGVAGRVGEVPGFEVDQVGADGTVIYGSVRTTHGEFFTVQGSTVLVHNVYGATGGIECSRPLR